MSDDTTDPSLSLLFADSELPRHDRDSGALRLYRILEILAAEGHSITFLANWGVGQEVATARLLNIGVEEVFPVSPAFLANHNPQASAAVEPLPQLMRRRRFDIAWISRYETAETLLPTIRLTSPLTRVVVDSVDVHWIREHRGAALTDSADGLRAAEQTRLREQAIYGAADLNIAVSDTDAQAIHELASSVPVSVVSNVHDFRAETPGPNGRSGILFVGSFKHRPNVDAVLEFHRATWPLIRARIPGVSWTIAGSDPPSEIQNLSGPDIAVTGWVPTLDPFLRTARVSIAPLRYGAGVKGKIAEAIGAGLPVVSTTIGVEGMDLRAGRDVLVADDPEAFADAVARLYSDDALWARLVNDARHRLEPVLGQTAARTALRAALTAACPPRWYANANTPGLAGLLRRFGETYDAGSPARLTLAIPRGNPRAGADAVAHVTSIAESEGLDLDAMADVELTELDADDPIPANTVTWPPSASGSRDRKRSQPQPELAVVVEAAVDAQTLATQLKALEKSLGGARAEVVITSFGYDTATAPLLSTLGGARVIRCDGIPGRSSTWRLGVEATRAAVIVYLGPMVLPSPGLIEPLVRAASGDTSFAAPSIDGHGALCARDDGSLHQLDPAGQLNADAVALDCLAARREIWEPAPSDLTVREGHIELQLGTWAQRLGPVVLQPEARAVRLHSEPVTVIVCTRNNAAEISGAIAALLGSGEITRGSEVVIVDNASTDGTAAIVQELAARFDEVTAVYEPMPGLSHARNAGAAAAKNEFLVYLDDDARPAPGWLSSIAWALSRPGVVSAGGPIAALWPPNREAGWPPVGSESALSVLDLGDAVRVLQPPMMNYGANWAIRCSALRAIGGFDAQLGYAPDNLIGGEEVAAAWLIDKKQLGTVLYTPWAGVGHRISADRVSDRFVIDRNFRNGIELVRLQQYRETVDASWLTHTATESANALIAATGLSGALTTEEALDTVANTPAPLAMRGQAAVHLGRLVAAVLTLGELSVTVGALELRLRNENLFGVLGPEAPTPS